MIHAKHEKKINIIRVGDCCDKTPVKNDGLRQTFCSEIPHEFSESCKQANSPIGLLKPPKPIFNLVERRIMHTIREEPIRAERRDRHAATNVARIRFYPPSLFSVVRAPQQTFCQFHPGSVASARDILVVCFCRWVSDRSVNRGNSMCLKTMTISWVAVGL